MFGTFNVFQEQGKGSLQSLERDGCKVRIKEVPILTSTVKFKSIDSNPEFQQFTLVNGIAFDEEAGMMYFVDSAADGGAIKGYDYDSVTGDIANERNVFSLVEHGLPFELNGVYCVRRKKMRVFY